MRKIVAYLRVSTNNGRQKTESQRSAIERYIRANKLKAVEFVEDFASGRNTDRAGFQSIIERIQRREIDTLLCWKLDRLGRSCRQVCETIKLCLDNNVKLILLVEQFTFDGPIGVFLAQVFGAIAELEASTIALRVSEGMQAAKARGVVLGRKRDDRIRKRIANLRKRNMPVKQIAAKLNRTEQSIYRLLKSA